MTWHSIYKTDDIEIAYASTIKEYAILMSFKYNCNLYFKSTGEGAEISDTYGNFKPFYFTLDNFVKIDGELNGIKTKIISCMPANQIIEKIKKLYAFE